MNLQATINIFLIAVNMFINAVFPSKCMKVVIVTGTPGTGKTSYAKKFAKQHSYLYVDVNAVIKSNNLREKYDRKRKCYAVDTDKLCKVLIRMIETEKQKKSAKTGMVIDSHLSHYLPKSYVDLCIVTKCDLCELKKRLEKRGYHKSKVRENLESEIFEVCLIEAQDNGHRIKIIHTDSKTCKK
jgi:adenylate kinase